MTKRLSETRTMHIKITLKITFLWRFQISNQRICDRHHLPEVLKKTAVYKITKSEKFLENVREL